MTDVGQGLSEALAGTEDESKVEEIPNPDETKIKDLTAFCKKVGRTPEGWSTAKAAEKRVLFRREFLPEEAKTDTFDPGDLIHVVAERVENLGTKEARPEVRRLSENVGQNFFELGGVLSRISSEGWYAEYGHENMKSFVEAETGFGYSRARYMMRIYNRLVELEIPWSKFEGIGWWKVGTIIDVISRDSVDDWVARAKVLDVMALAEEVREHKRRERGGDPSGAEGASSSGGEAVQRLFKLYGDQAETVDLAIGEMKDRMPTDHNNVALTAICSEWLAGGESTSRREPQGLGPRLAAAFRACQEQAESDYDAAVEIDGAFEAAIREVFPGATLKVEIRLD